MNTTKAITIFIIIGILGVQGKHFWCFYAWGPIKEKMLNCDQRQNKVCQTVSFTYEHEDYGSFWARERDGGATLTIYVGQNCTGPYLTFDIGDDLCIYTGTFRFGGEKQEQLCHYSERRNCPHVPGCN